MSRRLFYSTSKVKKARKNFDLHFDWRVPSFWCDCRSGMVLLSLILLCLFFWSMKKTVFGFSFKCQSFRLQSFLITMCLPIFSQQSELLGYIDPQFATPHLRFPIQSLSLSQSPSLILQGLVSEQQVQNDLHAENEFWV